MSNSNVVNNTVDMAASRKAYAKTAKAKLKYIADLSLYLADVPNDQLLSYTADMKDIAAGSHFDKIHKERATLIDLVVEQGIKKAGARTYWKAAFDAVIKGRGLKRAKMKGGKKAKTKTKTKTKTETETETETGYTPEKAAAAINQLIAWANGQEAAKFNVTQFVSHLNKAVKEITK
jgi:hypothetical protein